MKRKRLSRSQIRSCAQDIGPEDGADPKLFFRKRSEKKLNRKALQLCGEVSRTLQQVLAWELADDLLNLLRVEAVVPAPDSSRLLVTVSVTEAAGIEPGQIMARLRAATGRLRTEIAAAVERRRVPDLAFQVSVRKEGTA
jgi:ribosome-binding factor A